MDDFIKNLKKNYKKMSKKERLESLFNEPPKSYTYKRLGLRIIRSTKEKEK